MPFDQPKFLHKNPNREILPSSDELRAFLEAPREMGRMGTNGDDVAPYGDVVTGLAEYQESRKKGRREPQIEKKLYFGALENTGIVSPELKSSVEHFKYYLQALLRLDTKKPAAFIRSAEEEISRLKPSRKDDAAKIERLQGMIDERKKELEALKKRWPAFRTEMTAIIIAARNEIEAIRKRSETALHQLLDPGTGAQAEDRFVEAVKTHFKNQVRDDLHNGPLTKEYLESVKETVAALTRQIPSQIKEDVTSVAILYRSIQDYAAGFTARLDPLVRRIAGRPQSNLDDDKEFFSRAEQELVAFLSGFRIEYANPTGLMNGDEHQKMLEEERGNTMDWLFELLCSGREGNGQNR